MDDDWPDVVIDEDDAILDQEILLSGAVAHSAAAAIGNLVGALQGFCDALRVIHDDAVLSQSELRAEYIED